MMKALQYIYIYFHRSKIKASQRLPAAAVSLLEAFVSALDSDGRYETSKLPVGAFLICLSFEIEELQAGGCTV